MEADLRVKRKRWLDCTKAVAIIAVIVDHTYGVLHGDKILLYASFFSVGLFVLTAGFVVNIDRVKSFSYQAKKVGKMFLQYAIATAIVLFCVERFFDLKQYIMHLLNFSITPSYYYMLFFIQLILISPLLAFWFRICECRRGRMLFHVITLLVLCWMASIFVRYTYVLPVWGGGQYIFGGTYIVLYYIGILISNLKIFDISRWSLKTRIVTSIITLLVFGALVWARVSDNLVIDKVLSPYWGEGINPPSIQAMLLAMAVFIGCYAFFTLLVEVNCNMIKYLLRILEIVGQNTLYVFLYHLLVRDILRKLLSNYISIWFIRVLIFISMITLPVIVAIGVKQIFIRVGDNNENA